MGMWSDAKNKLEGLVEAYGMVAVGTLLTIRVVEFAGVWIAMSFGFEPTGATANIGTFWVVMGATQLSKPFRIALAVALTPFVAAGLQRLRGNETAPTRPDIPEDEAAGA